MKKITVQQKFDRPVADVFDVLSKHATFAKVFWPAKIVRVKDSNDPNRPDGVGSIRHAGFGPIMPLTEEITYLEENQRIEYQIINNPLVKKHLGALTFKSLSDRSTLVTYDIELQAAVPFLGGIILSQLKLAMMMGMSRLAKSMK